MPSKPYAFTVTPPIESITPMEIRDLAKKKVDELNAAIEATKQLLERQKSELAQWEKHV